MAGHFEALDDAECAHLLRAGGIGRVAFEGPEGILVLPVEYQVVDDIVVFKTAPGTALGALGAGAPVSFQIDDIDPATGTGWSVLAHGHAAAWDGDPLPSTSAPWAPGPRDLPIGVRITKRSGRAVSRPD